MLLLFAEFLETYVVPLEPEDAGVVSYLPYAVAAWICLVGLAGVATSRNLIHLAICLTVTQSSSYVLLLSVGYVKHGKAPIFKGIEARHARPSTRSCRR